MQKCHDALPGPGVLDRMAGRLASAAFARPRATLALLVLLVLGAALAATRLGIDTDSSRMLDPSLPFQERTQAINAAFPSIKNTLLVVVRGPHADAVEAATARLAETVQARDTVERAFAPSANDFLIAHGLLYEDLDAVEARLDRLAQSSNLLAELRANQSLDGFLTALDRAVALVEGAGTDPDQLAPLMREAALSVEAAVRGEARPLDWSAVASGEAREGPITRVVTVEPVLDFTRLKPAQGAIDAVEAEIAALPEDLRALVEIGVTGDPALRAEELDSVTATLPLSLGLSLVLVALILALSLGRASRVAAALGVVVVTIVLTTGFAALAVGALNLVSVAFVVLMVGLGVDFAIHLLLHLDEDTRQGRDAAAALDVTTRSIGGALALSAATTALAFLAFATTDFIGMAQLGLIGAAGVVLALLVALTLIPALVALYPRLAHGAGPLRVPRLGAGAARVGAGLALVLGVGAMALAPSARFDADPMGLRDPAAEPVRVYDWLTEDARLAPLRLSVLAESAERAAAVDAEAEALAFVSRSVWLGDLVPEEQDAKLDAIDFAYPSIAFALEGEPVALGTAPDGATTERLAALDLPAAERLTIALEDWRAAGAALTGGPSGALSEEALGATLFRFFPQLLDRLALQLEAGPVAIEDLPEPLIARYRTGDGRHRVEIAAEGDLTDPDIRRAFVEAVTTAIPEAAGPPAQIVGAAQTISGAMVQALALAFAATALAGWLVLRSALAVVAVLAPLVLAGALTMATSVLLGLPFNYANIIVLPLMIGIGVDTGVHLAVRATRQGASGVFATSTPRAALASALTTIAAFGTLALSDHRGTASMGVMLVIALVASLAMIFALTPPIVGRRRRVPDLL